METLVDLYLGKNIPYISLAVPFFFLLIFVELAIGWFLRRPLYRLSDSINDLSCGILQQVLGLFLRVILFVGYLYLYKHYAMIDMLSLSPVGKYVAAIALFFAVDLCYYWFHRASHEMNAPWAGHIVHHQSEEYNLAVALRQGAFQAAFSWVFYLPLAVIGFPPVWFVAMSSLNTIYQFWIHTRAVGKLGWLEWFLNTPSHHRVHHGRNPKYLDKNHAGILIIWDRMFGTFQEEEEEPVYGIVRPLSSWNPLWANVHEFVELGRDAWSAPYWFDKIKIWFMPPGWRPRGIPERPEPPEVTADTVVKYETPVPWSVSLYNLAQFVVTLLLSLEVLDAARSMSMAQLAIPAVLVTWALTNIGGIFERRPWVWASEWARLVVTASAGAIYAGMVAGPAGDVKARVYGIGSALLFAIAGPWFFAIRGFLAGSEDRAVASPQRVSSPASMMKGEPVM